MKIRSQPLQQIRSRYPSWPQLSDQDVYRVISEQLAQVLPTLPEGYTCDQHTVWDIVLKASLEGSAIEGACNDLDTAPTGATVRHSLNAALPVTQLQAIEDKLQTQLETHLPKRLWRAPVELACDFHHEPFYGKTEILRQYACRGEAHAGTTWFYRVATAYVNHAGVPDTVALTFVLPGDTALAVLQRLLERVYALKLPIGCLYLDKGLGAQPVRAYLEKGGQRAILACAIRGKTGGTRALCHGRRSYFTKYTFAEGKYPADTVRMAVVRTYENKKGHRKATWLLYGVIHVKVQDPQTIRVRYRSRFGIESSYRCMRDTHATTTSRNPVLRFLLIGVAVLLVNLWINLRWHFAQIPRRGGRTVNKPVYELQRQRHFLARVIDKLYDAVDRIEAQAVPLDP
jgi:hypothetical protein